MRSADGSRASVPMTVRLAGSTTSHEVAVVTLSDGRLGFVAPAGWPRSAAKEKAPVELTGGSGEKHVGASAVVASGTAYEEVRGRLRAEGSRWHRRRNRRDRPVVLVTPDQANRPSAR